MSNGVRDRERDVVEAPLMLDEVQALFRGFIRQPGLIAEALRLGLDASHFTGMGEYVFAVLFAVLRETHEQYGNLTKDIVNTTIRANTSSGRIAAPQIDLEFLLGTPEEPGFVDATFDEPVATTETARTEKRFFEDLLRRFLRARLVTQGLQSQLGRGTTGSAPSNISDLLGRFHRLSQQVAHVGLAVGNSATMPSFGAPIALPPPAVPVGLPWLDQYVGGIRAGDIIGVLAPFGGGKSTLLSVAAVRIAQHYYCNGENKLSVFIGYEDGGSKWNHMFWSAAARIERKLFTDHGADIWAHFSTRDRLKDYDRLLPENRNGEIMFGERERWESAMVWLNHHFVYLDFSCNSETGGRGAGGVPEIVQALDRLSEERGMEIGFCAIDYTGILVERFLGAKSTDLKDIIRPIKKVPDDLRTQIAVPKGTTIMLAHQLATNDIKGRPVYKYVGHADASGSKSFAENVHACMGINERDHATNVSTIYWSKLRAVRPLTPYGLIKMDDHVVDVHLVNDDYIACPTSRAILRKGDVRVVDPYASTNQNNSRRGWDTDSLPGDF